MPTATPPSVHVVVTKNDISKVPPAVRRIVSDAIERGARLIEATAKGKAPVATGTLRRSIHTVLSNGGLTATVGPSVEYAPYVEFGTRHRGARPFMRPAAELHIPRIVDDVKRALSEAP